MYLFFKSKSDNHSFGGRTLLYINYIVIFSILYIDSSRLQNHSLGAISPYFASHIETVLKSL